MTTGNIEAILQGEKQLEELETQNYNDVKMTPDQREKTVEILKYIKRQNILREQRLIFQKQLKNT